MRKKTRIFINIILSIIFSYFLYNLYNFYRIFKENLIFKNHINTVFKQGFQFKSDLFGLKYIGYSNEFIDLNILLYGAYEKYELFFLRDLVQKSYKEHCVFMDIGAHAGQHSLFMSKYADTIHAFEPYPPLVSRFTEMIEINKIKNIIVHPIGLGAINDSIPFYEPPSINSGIGSFLNEWYTKNEGKKIYLEIVKGDELPDEIIKKIDLVKLDTEGYEKNIILGMNTTLKNNRPIVVMELNIGGEQMWKNEEEIYKTFPPDYRILYLEPIGTPSCGKYRLTKFFFDCNRSLF